MAEKQCPHCKMMIDQEATICPHCRKPQGWSTAAKAGLIFFIFIFIIIISTFNNSSKKRSSDNIFSAARGACLLALKSELNDPYSAEFDATSTWYVEKRKDGTIRVQPTLRAKNTFGAYVYSTWDCITKEEHENIKVLSLKQIRGSRN